MHAATTSETAAEASHWARVRLALADCLEEQGEAGRAAFLARLRETDPGIAQEVAELAELGGGTASALDRPPGQWLEDVVRPRPDRRMEGLRLGPWRLVRHIASGGMGDVFLGERADGAFRMQVAVKLMREGLAGPQDIARFGRERQILANLEHVNLVRLLDGGVTGAGLPYFVMELIDGEPIDTWCARTRAPLAERIGLLRKVCAAVHYVNRCGVIHRDLKPRNILVTPAGEVKLVDFGVATRLPGTEMTAAEPTRTAMRAMTMLYASPEQIRGDPVGPASDVYALGVVMVRLLAGALPYAVDPAAASGFEVARAICDTEPRRMSQLVPAGPGAGALRRALAGDLDAIAAKALRKEAAARYQDAAELDDDLFRHLSMLPVRARRGALGHRFGRWLLKHRALAGAAIAANVVLVAGIAATLVEVHEARQQRARADQNFASVRGLTNDFLFQFHDAVENLPGSLPARKLVVEKAQQYLKVLAAQARDSGDAGSLTLDLGVSHRKIGNFQEFPSRPNLGDHAGALASYAESIRLLTRLAAGGPGIEAAIATQARMELARTYLSLASVQSASVAYDDALRSQEAAEAALAPLHDDESDRMRALAYGGRSWVLHEKGDQPGFEKYATLSEQVLERLAAAHPRSIDHLIGLQHAYARRAASESKLPDTPENDRRALASARKLVEIGQRLSAIDGRNPKYLAGIAESDTYLGLAQARMGDKGAAMESLRRGLSLMERQLALDPRDDSVLEVLIAQLGTLARMEVVAGRPESARDHALRAIELYAGRTEDMRANDYSLLTAAQAHAAAARAWTQIAARPHAPAQARGQACAESLSAAGLIGLIKDVPPPEHDYYDLADLRREAARCPSGAGVPRPSRTVEGVSPRNS